MTANRPPRVAKPTRPSDPSVTTLFRKPVTGWYAEWKARKSTAAKPTAAESGEPTTRPADAQQQEVS